MPEITDAEPVMANVKLLCAMAQGSVNVIRQRRWLRLEGRGVYKGTKSAGFTLIELLVVIAIIMILAATLVPALFK